MRTTGWKRAVLSVAATLMLPIFAPATPASSSENLPAAMTGDWNGTARIIVVWCQQTNLPVSLAIKGSGVVGGTVGDATLKDARLKKNRGWLGRKLNLKTDYVIVGRLAGPIIAREDISRSRVSMPLNFAGGRFVGGVHTSGTKWGGKERMILSASHLILVRTNAP
jgi:hypothetical protein